MSEVDFLDEEKAHSWLEKQTPEARCYISSRAALRVSVNLAQADNNLFNSLALMSYRAILIASIRSYAENISLDFITKSASAAANGIIQISNKYANLSNLKISKTSKENGMALASGYYATQAAYSALSWGSASDARATYKALNIPDQAAISATIFDSSRVGTQTTDLPLWPERKMPDILEREQVKLLDRFAASKQTWSFWHDWYLAMWEGRFTDWELAVEVSQIPNEVWERGAEAIAVEITNIQRNRAPKEETGNTTAKEDAPPSALTTSSKENVVRNRDAIALNAAALIDQLDEFKERVRGLNHLEPEFKQELLNFIKGLATGLETLLANLPQEAALPAEDGDVAIAGWLEEFYPLMKTKAKNYVSPDNVSEAALPVSFILSFTAIGTMIAGPAGGGVGALVGGLITGQVKPGKAADELMEQSGEKND